ncbi:hypothetical protein K1719_030605 [Acacia pycnantha]|nr:hypothetical protein K1719_030605 [Acacia pycnantha]
MKRQTQHGIGNLTTIRVKMAKRDASGGSVCGALGNQEETQEVELNIEFVQRKRDDATFSPKDQQSVESFLQIEKRSGNTPFTHYYKSILIKATSRKLISKPKALFYLITSFSSQFMVPTNKKGGLVHKTPTRRVLKRVRCMQPYLASEDVVFRI